MNLAKYLTNEKYFMKKLLKFTVLLVTAFNWVIFDLMMKSAIYQFIFYYFLLFFEIFSEQEIKHNLLTCLLKWCFYFQQCCHYEWN